MDILDVQTRNIANQAYELVFLLMFWIASRSAGIAGKTYHSLLWTRVMVGPGVEPVEVLEAFPHLH